MIGEIQMNKIVKKLTGFFVACALAVSMSIAASAIHISGSSLGHSSDDWYYGQKSAWFLKTRQYSEFYCGNQYHTATAVIVAYGNRDQVRATASKGKWAKAETDKHFNFDQWNSYYNHPYM